MGARAADSLPVHDHAGLGQRILVIFYHMIRTGSGHADLGGDFFDRLEPEQLTCYYIKRLERLGHKVTLETSVTA